MMMMCVPSKQLLRFSPEVAAFQRQSGDVPLCGPFKFVNLFGMKGAVEM